GLVVRISNGTSFQDVGFPGPGAGFCAPESLLLSDLNGDGATDALCPANGNVALSSGRSFVLQASFGAFCLGEEVFTADVSNDGRPDLVCNHAGKPANDIEVRTWNGTTFGPAETWKAAWCEFGVSSGDFNGDGKTDLLCGHFQLALGGTVNVM